MKPRFIGALLLCEFLVLPVLSGQTTLSLDEAIAISLINNPEILRLGKDIDAARARTLRLGAVPNPELVFSNEGIPFRSGGGGRELSVGLRQLVEFPGKRGLRKAVGESGERVSEANLESARLLVVARVKKAYWKAAFSEMSVAHFLSVLDTVKEYQKMAAIRFQAGQVTSVDVLRGRLEEVRVQNEIIEAGRVLQEAKSALWLEMGVQAPAVFPSLAAMSHAPLTKGLDELKAEAVDRPSLRALRQELKLREIVLRLANKDLYPDVRLGLFYPSLYASGWGFELEVSLPLWTQARRGGVREAEALRQREMITLDYAVMRVMNRLESSYAGVQAASEQLSLIETSLLNDAADLLSAGIINYQHGRIGSLDLFDNYRMHKESRLQHLRALLNYHLALVELETAGEEPEA